MIFAKSYRIGSRAGITPKGDFCNHPGKRPKTQQWLYRLLRPCPGTSREGERETRKTAQQMSRTEVPGRRQPRLAPTPACDISFHKPDTAILPFQLIRLRRHPVAASARRHQWLACGGRPAPGRRLFRKVQADPKQAATVSMLTASDQMPAQKNRRQPVREWQPVIIKLKICVI